MVVGGLSDILYCIYMMPPKSICILQRPDQAVQRDDMPSNISTFWVPTATKTWAAATSISWKEDTVRTSLLWGHLRLL